jgi:hypothetical protein
MCFKNNALGIDSVCTEHKYYASTGRAVGAEDLSIFRQAVDIAGDLPLKKFSAVFTLELN